MAGGVINTTSYNSDLEPLGRKFFFDKEKELDPLYSRIFEEVSTNRLYEHDQVFGGLGLAPLKPQGSSIQYDSMVQGGEKVYTQATYATGFIITKEMVDFGQSGIVMKKSSGELRKALSDKKEELLADVINNAFNNSYTGFDSKELCATDHPIQDGLTISNELATAADLSEASLEQMYLEQKNEMKDFRGKRSMIPVKHLIVSTDEVMNAERILKTVARVGTSDNDVNAIRSVGFLPEPIMHHHRLSDADAFFLKCDVSDGLKVYQSEKPVFQSENDFDTFNMKYIAYERYGYGWSDYRVLFGTPGAA